MDEENDITAFQPTWQAAPLPFESDEPTATEQIDGIGDNAWLDSQTDGEPAGPGFSPLAGFSGPAPR